MLSSFALAFSSSIRHDTRHCMLSFARRWFGVDGVQQSLENRRRTRPPFSSFYFPHYFAHSKTMTALCTRNEKSVRWRAFLPSQFFPLLTCQTPRNHLSKILRKNATKRIKYRTKQVALMRHQLKTVASVARSGPGKYASMVSNVMDIPKPQESFREKVDNSRDTPFVPRLREKPNAVTPLDLSPVSQPPNMPPKDFRSFVTAVYRRSTLRFTQSGEIVRVPARDKNIFRCCTRRQAPPRVYSSS